MILDKIRNLPKIIILKIEILRLKAFLKRNGDRKSSYHRHYSDSCNAYFQIEETNKRSAMEEKIKKIIKSFKNNPQELFSFVEKENTKVYKINFVEKLLGFVNEKEGFIPPKNGMIAIYLNLITEKKFSSETSPMFIFDKNNCDYYNVLHQFYRWYSYKMDFPGFSQSAISKFHKLYSKNSDIELSIPDIDEIQEVLNRDLEAGLFVLQLSKEQDGSRQALNKIIQKNKVAI